VLWTNIFTKVLTGHGKFGAIALVGYPEKSRHVFADMQKRFGGLGNYRALVLVDIAIAAREPSQKNEKRGAYSILMFLNQCLQVTHTELRHFAGRATVARNFGGELR
jgi:hypothetical protein